MQLYLAASSSQSSSEFFYKQKVYKQAELMACVYTKQQINVAHHALKSAFQVLAVQCIVDVLASCPMRFTKEEKNTALKINKILLERQIIRPAG